MPTKITKEIHEIIYDLNKDGKSVKEILGILASEGTKISDKSIYKILKEKRNNGSVVSFDETFSESFGDDINMEEKILPPLIRSNAMIEEEKTHTEITQENNIDLQNLQELINKGVREGTEQVISMLNKDISESNDKLDEIIKETKKKTSKPLSINKLPQINPFNTDGMTEQEKRLRRDMIIKIRNYIDCFSDNEIIQSMCGDPILFKQKLYEKDLAGSQLFMRRL